MAHADHPWQLKTRPCPFYSQGRCLFADACNFRHDVKITVPFSIDDASPGGGARPGRARAGMPHPEGPVITVDSPRSLRSPRRSPRMANLLFALKSVIGEDEEDDEETEDEGEAEEGAPPSAAGEDAALAGKSSISFPGQEDADTRSHLGLFDPGSLNPGAADGHSVSASDDYSIYAVSSSSTGQPSPEVAHDGADGEDPPTLALDPSHTYEHDDGTTIRPTTLAPPSPAESAARDSVVTADDYSYFAATPTAASFPAGVQQAPDDAKPLDDSESFDEPLVSDDSGSFSFLGGSQDDGSAEGSDESGEPQPTAHARCSSLSSLASLDSPSTHRRGAPSASATLPASLLSPVQITPFVPFPFPLDTPATTAVDARAPSPHPYPHPRDDSLDSGYGERWPPTPGLSASASISEGASQFLSPLSPPPPSPGRRASTFDLLSSPFGSPSQRVFGLPGQMARLSPMVGPLGFSVKQDASVIGEEPTPFVLDGLPAEPGARERVSSPTSSAGEPGPASSSPASSTGALGGETAQFYSFTGEQSASPSADASFADNSLADTSLAKTSFAESAGSSSEDTWSHVVTAVEGEDETDDFPPVGASEEDDCIQLPFMAGDVASESTVSTLPPYSAEGPSLESPVFGEVSYVVTEPTQTRVLPPEEIPPHELPDADDTINSLYSVYSIGSPEQDAADTPPVAGPSSLPPLRVSPFERPPSSASSRSSSRPSALAERLSRASSPASSFGGRVFTPPPGRHLRDDSTGERARSPLQMTDTEPTSASTSSPSRSVHPAPFPERLPSFLHHHGRRQSSAPESPVVLGSPFYDRRSPLVPEEERGTPSRPSVAEDGAGRVPFGFRHSFALGRSNDSSLLLSRAAKGRGSALRQTPPPLRTYDLSPSDDSVTPVNTTTSDSSSASSKLRPLRLSRVLSPALASNIYPGPSTTKPYNSRSASASSVSSPTSASASVYSQQSLTSSRSLSNIRVAMFPEHIRRTLIPQAQISPLQLSSDNPRSSLRSAPALRERASWRESMQSMLPGEDDATTSSSSSHLSGSIRETGPTFGNGHFDDHGEDQDMTLIDPAGDATASSLLPAQAPERVPVLSVQTTPTPTSAPSPLSGSAPSPHLSFHMPSPLPRTPSISTTPRPDLLFAVASDDPSEVQRVLAGGRVAVNDRVGPQMQSALAFAIGNAGLARRVEIVRTLLAYGADPARIGESPASDVGPEAARAEAEAREKMMDEMDPATRYYVAKAEDPQVRRASALIHRSFFRPLARVRYDLIGQDRALEQLFRVLSMHSQQLSVAPIVVLLCGPSGHGKTLVARRFGSLLDVPTHTVNMVSVRSGQDLWQSYSTSPDEEPTTRTLAEFLTENEGKRCVVVLDEIEKTEDEKALWSLHMPWEMGRCLLEAGRRHIDVRNVVWLATSNIGNSLVFEHQAARRDPTSVMSREEYVELMSLLRPRVSERLGAALLSRVTTVLPFVPFTDQEKVAIAAEAIYSIGGELAREMAPAAVRDVARRAAAAYIPDEGSRSLYRAVSTLLMDDV